LPHAVPFADGEKALRMSSSPTTVAAVMTDRDVVTPGPARAASRRSRQVSVFFIRVFAFLFGSKQATAAVPSVDQPSDLYRTAVHESGHALAARLLGKAVLLATTVPNAKLGFGGRVITGSGDASSAMSRSLHEGYVVVDEIASVVDRHMPGPGETKDDAAPWLTVVHGAVTEWLAGAAAESIVFGSADDRRSRTDYLSARRYARTICSSDVSAEAFVEFVLIEAVEAITPYRTVLLSLAAELVERRELDGDQIDQVIQAALIQQAHDGEMIRRAQWNDLTKRAAAFEQDRPQ
jgi:hypothetical protein